MGNSRKRRSRRRSNRPAVKPLVIGIGVGAATLLVAGLVTAALTSGATNAPTGTARPVDVAAPRATAVEVALGEGESLNVLFLGDSLASGLHASTVEAGFLPTMTRALEEDGAVSVTTGARAHATTGEVTGESSLGAGQHLVVIELGTNDVGREMPLDEFRETYGQIFANVRSTSPEAQFVCAGPWTQPDLARPYEAVIRDVCETEGGQYRGLSDLHVTEGMIGPAGRTDVVDGPSDTFHPNDTGHTAIAERLLGAISVGR